MSGGALNYPSHRLEELARAVASQSTKPLHRAFAQNLLMVAKAAGDLDLVLSGDAGEGSEDAAIRAVVSPAELTESASSDLRRAIADANSVLKELSKGRGKK